MAKAAGATAAQMTGTATETAATAARRGPAPASRRFISCQLQPQAPPQQPPEPWPPGEGAGRAAWLAAVPPMDTVDSNLTVSSCP